MLTKKEVKQTTERVLIGEIEFLEKKDKSKMFDLINSLDYDDRKAVNVYLKKKGY